MYAHASTLTSSVHINIPVIWDITPCNLVLEERRHLRRNPLSPSSSLLHWRLGSRFLWNVCNTSTRLPCVTSYNIIIFLSTVGRHSNIIQIFRFFNSHDAKPSKVHMREWEYCSSICKLNNRWTCVFRLTPRPLYPVESTLVPNE